ncbi:hypothetical protein [Novipirellula rosea]|uniref:Flagellar protein FliL n=1 Tax=Novipirellula rosea TaxID=1031540 RepID=A0ABP8MD75_9BACT
MQFSLRTIMIGVALAALAVAVVTRSLGRMEIDGYTNSTRVSFVDAETAALASTLQFALDFDDLIVDVEILDPIGPPSDRKSTRIALHMTGVTDRSLSDMKPIFPFTLTELKDRIEKELDQRLGSVAEAEVTKVVLSYDVPAGSDRGG